MQENNVILIRQQFKDFDQLLEVAPKWSLNFNQLDKGIFSGELLLVDVGDVQVGLSSFSRKFDQEGSTPSGYRTIALLASTDQQIVWRGQHVTGKNLLVFPQSNEINAVSYPGFKVYTVSISNEIVDRYFEQEGINDKRILNQNEGIVTPAIRVINDVRNKLEYLTSVINEKPGCVTSRSFHQIFTQEIPYMILKGALIQRTDQALSPVNIRKRSLKKAIEYLRESGQEMPTVPELCLIAGASQRTLEYAFKEQFGMNPKEYMKVQNLNRINKVLKASDPENTKVKEIANSYGFWHMGQFSADYKKLFYELPSKTLSKSK